MNSTPTIHTASRASSPLETARVLLGAVASIVIAVALVLPPSLARANDSTWLGNGAQAPGSAIWGGLANWTNNTPANGANNTATFGATFNNGYTVIVNTNRTIGNIVFTDPANANDLLLEVHPSNFILTLAGTTPTIDVTQAGRTLTINPIVAGADGLTKAGSGTLVLANANTYSGGTVINGGTVVPVLNASLGTGTVTVNSGGTLDINNRNLTALPFVLNGGTVINTVGSPQNAMLNVTFTADSTFAGTNRFDIRTTNSVNPTIALDGHTLTKAGTNKVALVEAFVTGGGTIDVTSGILGLTRAGGAGSFENVTIKVGPNGTLEFENNSSRGSYAANLELSSGNVRVGGNPATVTGTIALQGSNTFTTNAAFTASGQISGTGNLIKTEGGAMTLSGANNYTGTTSVNNGVLVVANTGALNGTSAINLGTTTGGILQFDVADTTVVAPITVADAGVTSTIRSNHTPGGGVVSNTNLNGSIGGAGNLAFTTAANLNNPFTTFTLNAQSTYQGSTTINAAGGTGSNVFLVLGIDDALPTGTVLTFGGAGGAGTGRQHNLNLNGNDQTLGGLSSTAANLRIQRINNTSGDFATLTINDDGNRTFTGLLGSTAVGGGINLNAGNNFGIVKEGTGTWTLVGQVTSGATNNLAAPNSYAGGTILNQGGITLGARATLGTGALQVNNTNSTGSGTNVVLTLPTDADLTVGSLSGTIATPTSGTNTAAIQTQTGRTLIVNQTEAGTYEGGIAGGGNLELSATSTAALTLAGTNTYTGATLVSGGTLVVNGAITSTSSVTVAGGTLAGAGSITTTGNSTTIGTGTTLAPGDATMLTGTGTLSLNTSSLTFDPGSFWAVNIAGADNGRLQLNTPASSIDLSNVSLVPGAAAFSPQTLTPFWILDNVGSTTLSGQFANMTSTGLGGFLFPETPSGFVELGDTPFVVFLNADFGSNSLSGGNDIVLFAIPEPSRAMLITLAIGAMFFRRRR